MGFEFELWVLGLRFCVLCLRFRVVWFWVLGLMFGVLCFGFEVLCFGFEVLCLCLGFCVQGLRFCVLCFGGGGAGMEAGEEMRGETGEGSGEGGVTLWLVLR